MLKERKRRIKRLLILFLVVALGVFLGIVLARWTGAISRDKKQAELKKILKDVVAENGEKALFSLADIPVREILYGDEGLTVLSGEEDTWNYSFSDMQNIRAYEEVSPSVVTITTSVSDSAQGMGSGFVLSSEGYVLTNAHVVENATTITVSVFGGKQYQGKIIGMDSEEDLAIVKVSPEKGTTLKPVRLGSSSGLKVGEKVIAIGNPFGYERTLTTGIVSGLNRQVRTEAGKVIMDAIQTDTALNPGNSGGPLLNGKGEVVGVTSSIFSLTGGGQGINFAIPIDTVVSLVPDLIKYGSVRRGWLDIVPVQLTKSLADYAKLSVTQGVLVSQVQAKGQAEKAGILGGKEAVKYGSSVINIGGDVIVAIDGKPITGLNDYYLALLSTREGDKVKVTVNRKGETKDFTVTLRSRQGSDVNSLVQ